MDVACRHVGSTVVSGGRLLLPLAQLFDMQELFLGRPVQPCGSTKQEGAAEETTQQGFHISECG